MPTLPEDWETAALSEVADVNPAKPTNHELGHEAPVSFVPMAALDARSGSIQAPLQRAFGDVRKSYTAFREGDVIYAKITPCMENGKVAVATELRNGIGFGSTEFHVVRPSARIDARYLRHFLRQRAVRGNAEAAMTGSVGQRRVPPGYLRDLPIPIPPADLQLEIVETLDHINVALDRALEHVEAAEELLDQFRTAVLADACTGRLTGEQRQDEGGACPPGWQRTTLGALACHVTSGSRGWAKYYTDDGPLFIRAQNLREDALSIEGAAHVDPPDSAEARRTRVEVGDLLITITGANVTKTGWVGAEIGPAYVSQHVGLVRCSNPGIAPFLYLWLLSPAHGRATLRRDAYGAGKPGLNLRNLKEVPVVLPPVQQVGQIVRTAFQLLAVADTAATDLADRRDRIDELREAAMNAAFRGELKSALALLGAS